MTTRQLIRNQTQRQQRQLQEQLKQRIRSKYGATRVTINDHAVRYFDGQWHTLSLAALLCA